MTTFFAGTPTATTASLIWMRHTRQKVNNSQFFLRGIQRALGNYQLSRGMPLTPSFQ
jgi:hypothetical protein